MKSTKAIPHSSFSSSSSMALKIESSHEEAVRIGTLEAKGRGNRKHDGAEVDEDARSSSRLLESPGVL